MDDKDFGLNDVVEMKKPHPCGITAGRLLDLEWTSELNVKDVTIVSC